MATINQLAGGAFQDSEGNLLANGFLLFQLSQDGIANGGTLVCAGHVIRVPLDANGNVQSSPSFSLWPNDVLTPSGSFYLVTAYTATGVKVWGPNAQQVLSSPSPYGLGLWVPNA